MKGISITYDPTVYGYVEEEAEYEGIHKIYRESINPQNFLLEIQKLPEGEINDPDHNGLTLLQKTFLNKQPKLALELVKNGAMLFPNDKQHDCLALLEQIELDENLEQDFAEIIREQDQQIKQSLKNDPVYAKNLIFSLYEKGYYTLLDTVLHRAPNQIDLLKELFEKSTPNPEDLAKIQQYDDLIDQNQDAIDVLEQKISSIDARDDADTKKKIEEYKDQILALKTQKDEARKAKQKLYEPYIEKASNVLRLTTKSIKYKYLKDAVLVGNNTRIEFLTKTSNLIPESNNILKMGLGKIHTLEQSIRENKILDPDQISNTLKEIKGIYRSMNSLLKRKDFHLKVKSELNNGESILVQAYKDFKEANERTRYHKKLFFEALFYDSQTQEYLKQNGNPLLELAAKYKDKDVYRITYFFMDSTALEKDKEKLLFNAAVSGSEEIFSDIIEGANISDTDITKLTREDTNTSLLMAACSGGNQQIIEKILNCSGDQIKNVDKDGNTILHYLAGSKSTESKNIVASLLKAGAGIETKNKQGYTPLISAVLLGNVNLVKELIAKGANINAIDKNGNTPLIYAVDLNNKEMIGVLLENNELNVTHKNKDGISAYAISISRDIFTENLKKIGTDQIKVLNENYVKPSSDDIDNQYPLLSKTLLRRGADPYQVTPSTIINLGLTASIAYGAVQTIKTLTNLTKNTSFEGAGELLYKFANFGSSYVVAKAAKEYFKNNLTSLLTTEDERLNLTDEIIIGSVHRGSVFDGEFSIKTGRNLKNDMEKHNHFKKNTVKDCIYDKKSLDKKIKEKKEEIVKETNENKKKKEQEFKIWAVKAQKTLQDQYVTLERRIENRSFLVRNFDYYTDFIFGNETSLQQAKQQILEASELLSEHSGRKITTLNNSETTFESYGENLIDILKDSNKAELLLAKLVLPEKKENTHLIEKIIEDITSKKILVAPDTFSLFCKFAYKKRTIKQDTKIIPSSDSLVLPNFSEQDLEAFRNEVINLQKGDQEAENNTPKTFKDYAWAWAQTVGKSAIARSVKIFSPKGTTDKEALNKGIEIISSVGSAAVGLGMAAANDDKVRERTVQYTIMVNNVVNILEKTINMTMWCLTTARDNYKLLTLGIGVSVVPIIYNNKEVIYKSAGYGFQQLVQYTSNYLPFRGAAAETGELKILQAPTMMQDLAPESDSKSNKGKKLKTKILKVLRKPEDMYSVTQEKIRKIKEERERKRKKTPSDSESVSETIDSSTSGKEVEGSTIISKISEEDLESRTTSSDKTNERPLTEDNLEKIAKKDPAVKNYGRALSIETSSISSLTDSFRSSKTNSSKQKENLSRKKFLKP